MINSYHIFISNKTNAVSTNKTSSCKKETSLSGQKYIGELTEIISDLVILKFDPYLYSVFKKIF